MTFHFNAFGITLLMSGVGALLMSLLIFQKLGGAIRWFSLMMLCIAVWAIAYGFELSCSTLSQMLFWIDIEYIGISFLPTTWIVFVIKFIGKEKWLTLTNKIIIFSFPTVALLLVWTNQWHHLHYTEVSVDNSGHFPLLAIKPGPWYHIHTVYFYFMLAWGIVLMFRQSKKTNIIYRKQNIAIIIGALIPWLVNFIYLLGVRPNDHIDLTPYAFIVTSVVIGFGLLKYDLFDIVPLAREKVIEGMREGMLVLDSHHRVIDANKGMKDFFQQPLPNFVGKDIRELLPDQNNLYKLIERKSGDKLDIKLTGEKGRRFFEVTITPLSETDTISKGTLLIFWDITERKLIEDMLIDQARQLSALNQMKDRIFSVISHDLRSPLANLLSILQIAENEEITEEEFKSFIPSLSQNVDYTSSLLENLLYWSKSQLQGATIQPELFDLKEMLANKLSFFEKRAGEKNIRIENKVTEYTPLYADPNMILLVLRNLITNAIKFSRSGDTITISTETENHFTTICVNDTGVGMKEDTLTKLFGTETSSMRGTDNEQGTGLGLIICKDFIEKNRGTIWAESERDKGSSFCFKLHNKDNSF